MWGISAEASAAAAAAASAVRRASPTCACRGTIMALTCSCRAPMRLVKSSRIAACISAVAA
eukprot:831123-Prymnesium_polylepis.1